MLEDVVAQVSGVDVIIVPGILYANNDTGTYDTVSGPYPTVRIVNWGQPLLLVGSGFFGKRVGRLDMTFNDFGVLTSWNGNAIQLSETMGNDATSQVLCQQQQYHLMNLTKI